MGPGMVTMSGLREAFLAFRKANHGNTAIIFALAIIPIIGLVGAAVDYSRGNSAKAAMQAAVDATALMLSREVSDLTKSQLDSKATRYFSGNFNRTDVTGIKITPTYTSSGGTQLVVTGSGKVATTFMKVLGRKSMTIDVTSTVRWGSMRMRVALALDNTGSMAESGKMAALQTATKSLLNQLKANAASNGDIYVSIIPFSEDVNVGKANYSASWIDWTDWDDNNGQDSVTTTCSSYRVGKNRRPDRRCSTSTTWMASDHSTWNGCVTDRDQSYDTTVDAPTGSASINPSKLFPADQNGSCPAQMMGLSYDWNSMTTLVNQMTPAGTTNQAIGLAWAWLSLVGGGPLSVPVKNSTYQYQDVIVLLTDGLNTHDRWYDDAASIDARQEIVCKNIKAAGITLYTIQVNTGGDPTSTLLRNCASSPDKFFLLTTANSIVTTFNQIGITLSNLRLAK
jgi:Flp pilus assembly protein TadG